MTDLMVSTVASAAAATGQAESSAGVAEIDVSAFGNSLESAAEKVAASTETLETPPELTEVEKAVAKPLDYLNHEAAEIADYAQKAVEGGNTLSPSEIVTLTARSHEFMFHAQLTANVANRTSEGLQQLFRQQG